MRFEVFTAVKIQVEFFCVVTPCSDVIGYQCILEDLAASIFRVNTASIRVIPDISFSGFRVGI
jgi:hypothetical protein